MNLFTLDSMEYSLFSSRIAEGSLVPVASACNIRDEGLRVNLTHMEVIVSLDNRTTILRPPPSPKIYKKMNLLK